MELVPPDLCVATFECIEIFEQRADEMFSHAPLFDSDRWRYCYVVDAISRLWKNAPPIGNRG